MKLTDLYKLTSSTVQISNDDILLISDYNQNTIQSKAVNIGQLKRSFRDTFIYKTNGCIQQTLNLSVSALLSYNNNPVMYFQNNNLVIQNSLPQNIVFRTNTNDIYINGQQLSAKFVSIFQLPIKDEHVINKKYMQQQMAKKQRIISQLSSIVSTLVLNLKVLSTNFNITVNALSGQFDNYLKLS